MAQISVQIRIKGHMQDFFLNVFNIAREGCMRFIDGHSNYKYIYFFISHIYLTQ